MSFATRPRPLAGAAGQQLPRQRVEQQHVGLDRAFLLAAGVPAPLRQVGGPVATISPPHRARYRFRDPSHFDFPSSMPFIIKPEVSNSVRRAANVISSFCGWKVPKETPGAWSPWSFQNAQRSKSKPNLAVELVLELQCHHPVACEHAVADFDTRFADEGQCHFTPEPAVDDLSRLAVRRPEARIDKGMASPSPLYLETAIRQPGDPSASRDK